jgi:hypothetical protein
VRGPVVIGVIILGVAALSALVNAHPPASLADPASAEPRGAMAVSRLLGAQGVQVRRTADVPTAARSPADSTLVVVGADRLTVPEARLLARTRADVLLLTPPETVLGALTGALVVDTTSPTGGTRPPGCPWPVALRAGPASVAGTSYRLIRPQNGALVCYAPATEGGRVAVGPPGVAGRAEAAPTGPLVVLPQALPGGGRRTLTVLGDPSILTNAALADEGNAALALGLLGRHTGLTWLVAPALPPAAGTGRATVTALLGDPVRFGLVELTLVVMLVAAWRARQLGPAVPEPLPVAVPAAETTQGRARLYRQTRARAQAAAALRAATCQRLADRLGLPDAAAHDPATVGWAVAAVTGRDADQLGRLLGGGPDGPHVPRDDAALVALAAELDRLEKEVRHGEHTAPAPARRS